MATRPWVQFVVRWSVDDADRFVAMVTEMVEYAKGEPGTLSYDWYLDRDAGVGVLVESYESLDALVAHVAGPVFTEIAPRYKGAARPSQIDVFGADGLERGDLLKAPTTWWGEPVAAVTD